MLQLTKFYEQCYLTFASANPGLPNANRDPENIKRESQKLFLEIDQARLQKSKNKLLYYLDQKIWTEAREHLDDTEFCIDLKKEIIQGLHFKNTVFGTYTKTIEILRPLVEMINRTEKRPARVLELGSGIGKLTMAVYEQFQNSSMQVEMTGSDIVPEYVASANREAQLKNYNINFLVIDAYQLDLLEANSYDLIFTLHSMHHFRPEELSIIMAGSLSVAPRGFIGIDAYRGFTNLLFIALSGALKSLFSLKKMFFHDSFISGRKMYAAKQLEIMARIACPGASIEAENLKPGLTVIKILPQEIF